MHKKVIKHKLVFNCTYLLDLWWQGHLVSPQMGPCLYYFQPQFGKSRISLQWDPEQPHCVGWLCMSLGSTLCGQTLASQWHSWWLESPHRLLERTMSVCRSRWLGCQLGMGLQQGLAHLEIRGKDFKPFVFIKLQHWPCATFCFSKDRHVRMRKIRFCVS